MSPPYLPIIGGLVVSTIRALVAPLKYNHDFQRVVPVD
jgi:hypothetical protein